MGFVDVSLWDKQDLQTNKVLDQSYRKEIALILERGSKLLTKHSHPLLCTGP